MFYVMGVILLPLAVLFMFTKEELCKKECKKRQIII